MDKPRDFQISLFQQAVIEDIIVILPTGAGKTLIATMLINERLRQMKISKYIFVIAPKRSLVEQHLLYIQKHLEISTAKVNSYTSYSFNSRGLHIDKWTAVEWEAEAIIHQIIVLTPEILRSALARGVISVESIDAMIFDECHHANGKHPMAKIFRILDRICMVREVQRPKILGLTASAKNSKKGTIVSSIQKLETTMKCRCARLDAASIDKDVIPMPTSVGVLNKDSKIDSCEDIDMLLSGFIRPGAHLSLPSDIKLITYLAFKRIRFALDMCKLYRDFRTIGSCPSQYPSTVRLGLPRSQPIGIQSNSNIRYLEATYNVNSEFYGMMDRLYRNIGAAEKLLSEGGIIVGLYGFRAALGNQSGIVTAVPPVFASMVGRNVSSCYDDNVIDALIQRLKASLFPVQILIQVEKCYCTSLLELAIALGYGLDNDTFERALKILYDKGTLVSDAGIQCIMLMKSRGAMMTTTNDFEILTILSAATGMIIRLQTLRASLLRMCNALIDSLDAPFIHQQLYSSIKSFEYMSLKTMADTIVHHHDNNTNTYPIISNKIKILVKVLIDPPNKQSQPSFTSPTSSPKRNHDDAFGSSDVSRRSIVFCHSRLAVVAISQFLCDHATSTSTSTSPSFSPLKAASASDNDNDHLDDVGDNDCNEGDIVNQSAKKVSCSLSGNLSITNQNDILRKFKLGDALVLVATNIAEEGIDVQTCNLVVNFDHPHTLASYIQRRGRARARHSHIVSIIDNNDTGIDELRTMMSFEAEDQHFYNDETTSESDHDDDMPSSYMHDENLVLRESTGAIVDIHSSIDLLHEICQKLNTSSDQYCDCFPIIVNHDMKPGFQSSILLPACIPKSLRCVVSPIEERKACAEGIVALECIKRLHQAGLINHKFEVDNKINISIPVVSSNQDPSIRDEDDVASNHVSIKIVPDAFITNIEQNPSIIDLYLYKFIPQLPHNCNHDINCMKCSLPIDGIRDVGLAYLHPLSAELLETSFPTSMNGCCTGPSISIEYVEKRRVTNNTLRMMFRYHRAVACWTNNVREEKCCLSPSEFIDLADDLPTNINAANWSNSSNGAWYIAYPSAACPSLSDDDWFDYVSDCAADAEIFVHNLWILEKLKRSGAPALRTKGSVWMDDIDDYHELKGYIVTKLRSQMSLVVDCQLSTSDIDINTHQPVRLLTTKGISSQLSLYPLLTPYIDTTTPYHNVHHMKTYETTSEGYVILGQAKWYYLGIMMPSLAWRVQSMVLAIEARNHINRIVHEHNPSSIVHKHEPNIDMMLEALTPKRCKELMQFELLEYLGDSFLKFITSMELYRIYPHRQEGYLTGQRTQYISNVFLASQVRSSQLLQYLRATPLAVGKANLRIQPPGMMLFDKCLWNQHVVTKDTINPTKQELEARTLALGLNPVAGCHLQSLNININRSKQYIDIGNVCAKEPADLMEAIIGAYFISYGITGARDLLAALHILPTSISDTNTPIMEDESSESMIEDEIDDEFIFPEGFAEELKNLVMDAPMTSNPSYTPDDIMISTLVLENVRVHDPCDDLETVIQYRFQDRQLLRQALTHGSVTGVCSNQRLEFLGDAVLDFAVAQIMFREQILKSEGELTDKKSKSTRNDRLSIAALELGLHTHLQSRDPLLSELRLLTSKCLDSSYEAVMSSNKSLDKPLADVFEALVGAIFLDSGQDFEPINHLITHCHLMEDNNNISNTLS